MACSGSPLASLLWSWEGWQESGRTRGPIRKWRQPRSTGTSLPPSARHGPRAGVPTERICGRSIPAAQPLSTPAAQPLSTKGAFLKRDKQHKGARQRPGGGEARSSRARTKRSGRRG